jgi:serine/threonine protein kinase
LLKAFSGGPLSASTEPVREPTRTDSELGLTLANRYRLDRLIGTGGMSVVYRAADLALGRTVAVKLFRLDTDGDAGPARHEGEVAVLAQLNHFALVTLYDAGTEVVDGVGRAFIVTEFVDGTDLRSRIREGPIDVDEVARLGADLCAALHYVHSQGIIHRDIKPANVLLAPSDFPGRGKHAKLADFGIARLFDATHQTTPGTVIGTAGYLSPEQARGQAVGPASDVYSLGLVLLESLTAQQCYPGSAVESALARLQRQPEVPPWLGDDWRHLLTGMTVREPEYRLTAADAAIRLLALAPAARAPDDDATRYIVSPQVDTGEIAGETPAGDDRTAVLPAIDPPPPTTRLPQAPLAQPVEDVEPVQPALRTRRQQTPHRSRWPILIGGILAALVALAVAIFALPRPEPAPDPPAYPAVEGELGDHLEQLQERVIP